MDSSNKNFLLSKDLIPEWKAAKSKASVLESKIIDRIDYIINFIYKSWI